MTDHQATTAAALLWRHWCQHTRLDGLPDHCAPRDRREGYAIQSEVARLSGQRVAGWKIAATSVAGQRHIAVDGPLAGRLLSGRVREPGARVPLDGNGMRVAEAEFAFRFRKPLPARHDPFSLDEVMDAVESLHPAIEVPDSRYTDFLTVGAPQLIADTACACWVMFGPAADDGWRDRDMAGHAVRAYRNGEGAGEGSGAHVLGDPRVALTWLANELRTFGDGLRAGEMVITGTCLPPVALTPGDRVRMDFGTMGTIEAAFD